jgi:hypothetical protein
MMQWHPVFAQLLRPVVEDYYEIQTTVPVGDAPREADFVLLRRTSRTSPPFQGLWRHLTTWSILEFKGPTVTPRRNDIELLVELGLGIDRRLRASEIGDTKRHAAAEEVSFWYLANRLGRRFLRDAEWKLGTLNLLTPGLWRCQVLRRLVFLVSSVDLPVEPESLPLHVVSREPPAREREVAQLVVKKPGLQQLYGGWLASLHPSAWEEAEQMAKTSRREFKIDLRPAIKYLGLDYVIDQVGVQKVIDAIGPERVIASLGKKELVRRIGLDDFLASLSATEKRELKRRLQEQS